MEARDRWLYAWTLGYVAVGAASLLLPLYALSIGADPFEIGVMASTAAFAGVPGALLWGWLAHRTGRRRVFVEIALAAVSVALAVAPFVAMIPPLILLNALLWFAVSAASPVLMLLVVDGTTETAWERRIALLNTWQGYGWVAGLLVGSLWTPVAARVVGPQFARLGLFWLCAAAAVTGAVLSVRWVPRRTTVTVESVVRSPGLLARIDMGAGRYVRTVPFATTRLYWGLRGIEPGRLRGLLPLRLWGYLGAVLVFSSGFSVFWGPLPAYLGHAYADDTVFWFFLATNAAAAAFYSRAGVWAGRSPGESLQVHALGARGLLFPLVAVVPVLAPGWLDLPLLLSVFGVIGLTWAVIAVTAAGMVTRLAGGSRGTALGVYMALSGVGGGVGSIVGGAVARTYGYPITFALAGGLVLLGGVMVVAIRLGGNGTGR